MHSTLRSLGWLTLSSVVGFGCATPPAAELEAVSAELAQRTGASLADGQRAAGALPLGVNFDDGLNERECAALALWNDPDFLAALVELEVARAQVGAAGRLKDPSFTYFFAGGTKLFEWLLLVPVQDLWERPARVAAAQRDAERVAADLVRRGLALVRDVQRDFASCLLARDQLARAEEIVALQRRAERVATARLDAGEADAIEREAARTAVLLALEDERQLARQLAAARAGLSARVGAEVPFFELELHWTAGVDEARELARDATLLGRCLALHPDVRLAEAALALASVRLGLAKAEILRVDLAADANERPNGDMEVGPGVRFDLPIFNGGRGRRGVAEAELHRSALEYEAARQRVALAAKRAAIELETAEAGLASWRAEALPAIERLARATEKAFEAGDLPPSRSIEAALALARARQREASFESALRVASSELEFSVGGRLQPAHLASAEPAP